jgi:hypothetical protein
VAYDIQAGNKKTTLLTEYESVTQNVCYLMREISIYEQNALFIIFKVAMITYTQAHRLMGRIYEVRR